MGLSHIIRFGDERLRVEATAEGEIHVEGSEATFRVAAEPDGSYLVRQGSPGGSSAARSADGSEPSTGGHELQRRVLVTGAGDRRQVFVDGEVYDLLVEPAGRPRRAGGQSHVEQLTVPMPARVVKILVSVGQQVHRGDVVMKLEAMKMELPLRAPRDGTVRAVACREGDLVQPGASVLEIA